MVRADEPQRVGRVELLDEHAGRAVERHRAEPGVQAVRVEQRDGKQHRVVRAERRRLDRAELGVVGDERAGEVGLLSEIGDPDWGQLFPDLARQADPARDGGA